MWAEAAVHARQVPYDRDPYLRSGETEGRGGSQDPGVRRGTTQATESGGSVLGTKEPDWIAALAPTQNQVRAGAVLPSCCGTEPETTGAVPQHESATSDGKRVSNHLPKEKHESEETPLRENASSKRVFQHQRDFSTVEYPQRISGAPCNTKSGLMATSRYCYRIRA